MFKWLKALGDSKLIFFFFFLSSVCIPFTEISGIAITCTEKQILIPNNLFEQLNPLKSICFQKL